MAKDKLLPRGMVARPSVHEARAGLIPESDWTAKLSRLGVDDDGFKIPEDIRRAAKASRGFIKLAPAELVALMDEADEALNGDSNDAEHDALFSLREQLSEIFEDPTRATNG